VSQSVEPYDVLVAFSGERYAYVSEALKLYSRGEEFMDNVPAESSGNSELWPRTKEEVDEFLRRASANIRWLKAWGQPAHEGASNLTRPGIGAREGGR